MIKDLLGSTESSSVGVSSTSGFSAEVLKTENFILRLTTQNALTLTSDGKLSASRCGCSRLTRSGDGQYCIVVSVRALSHCVERIDGEVVRGGGLQASDGEGRCPQWKHIGIQETRRAVPAVSVNQKVQ